MAKFEIPKILYHVSPVKGITKLKPMSDKYSNDRPDYVPKISLGTTIHGCVQALCLPGKRRNFSWDNDDGMIHTKKGQITKYKYMFYVYAVDTTMFDNRCVVETVDTSLDKTAIFDIDITQEVAYSAPIKCTCIGTIEVEKLKELAGVAGCKLPVMINCTRAIPSTWELDLLDFEVGTSDKDNPLLEERLLEDRSKFYSIVSEALDMYTSIIRDNAKKAVTEYIKAGKLIKQNLK